MAASNCCSSSLSSQRYLRRKSLLRDESWLEMKLKSSSSESQVSQSFHLFFMGPLNSNPSGADIPMLVEALELLLVLLLMPLIDHYQPPDKSASNCLFNLT